jgi:hypothetical protein
MRPSPAADLTVQVLQETLDALVRHTRPRRKRNHQDVDPDLSSDPAKVIDLPAFLRSYREPIGAASVLPASWFADSKRLGRLEREAAKRPHGTPLVAASDLSAWNPPWVGENLPKDDRVAWVRALGVDERLTVVGAAANSPLAVRDKIKNVDGTESEDAERMLETLATELCDFLLRQHPLAKVAISIEKHILPDTECVAVHIERSR